MRRAVRPIAAVLLSATAAAPAAAQVLKFDDVPDADTSQLGVLVGDFYNGAGGAAFNFGVQFVGDAAAFCLNRVGTPSCSNVSWGGDAAAAARGTEKAGLDFGSGTPIMNRAAGFTTGFSFFYSNPFAVSAVFEVWSGLNATGTLLASAAMPGTTNGATNPNCFGSNYCPNVANSVAFAGVARSVRFTGNVNQITYDDITLGSTTPGQIVPEPTTVPEPATVALVAGGLLALGGVARRRRSA